ncbi:hypothetical protein BN2127_JRS1_01457 [Bacillus cereus]|nr:hypothetical protein BN2127_JRS1_01457 [Bacillus cereus]
MFPVDDLINIESHTMKKRLNKKRILEKLSKKDEAINLVLELGPKAIAQFKKYHPFKISISYTNPYQSTAVLKTFIDVHNSDEVIEMTNWLLFLGKDITIKEMPNEVLEALQEQLSLYCP